MEADEMNDAKTVVNKLYPCDICEESFTTRIILMMHKDVKHSQQLPDIGGFLSKRAKSSGQNVMDQKSLLQVKNEPCPIFEPSETDPLSIYQENGNFNEDVNEENSVDEHLSVHLKTENINVCEDIKEEVKENEESVEDNFSFHVDNEISSNVCEGISQEENAEDPLSIYLKTEISDLCEDIKEEIEEESLEDPISLNKVKEKQRKTNCRKKTEEDLKKIRSEANKAYYQRYKEKLKLKVKTKRLVKELTETEEERKARLQRLKENRVRKSLVEELTETEEEKKARLQRLKEKQEDLKKILSEANKAYYQRYKERQDWKRRKSEENKAYYQRNKEKLIEYMAKKRLMKTEEKKKAVKGYKRKLDLATANERPYECDMCDKTFQYKSKLNMHKKIHSDEKPYLCKICNKSYSRKSGLTQHNTTAGHLKRVVDFEESIKVEVILEDLEEIENIEN